MVLADYSKVQQIRGFLEHLVCQEVVALEDGVGQDDLNQGILPGEQFSFRLGFN